MPARAFPGEMFGPVIEDVGAREPQQWVLPTWLALGMFIDLGVARDMSAHRGSGVRLARDDGGSDAGRQDEDMSQELSGGPVPRSRPGWNGP